MKTTTQSVLFVCLLALVTAVSCQRDVQNDVPPKKVDDSNTFDGRSLPVGTSEIIPNPYQLILEGGGPVAEGSNWVWTWRITNTNPGVQALSHWGFPSPGACLSPADIVTAAYSSNGTSWRTFTPSFQMDPSTSNCIGITPVLKFNFGTNGSAPSYYRLTINKNLNVGEVIGYFKSGSNTGCGRFTFQGISCTLGS